MRTHGRLIAVSAVSLAFALWILAASNRGGAAAKAGQGGKEMVNAIKKIADMIEKNNADPAKEVDAAAKKVESLGDDVMHVFKPRKKDGKGGLGVGNKPGAIAPDGIEAKLLALARKPLLPAALAKEADALARMAYISAAVAQITEARTNEDGKKGPKEWKQWSQDMYKSSLELAKASKAKDSKGILAAAGKLNASCSDCHAKFRD